MYLGFIYGLYTAYRDEALLINMRWHGDGARCRGRGFRRRSQGKGIGALSLQCRLHFSRNACLMQTNYRKPHRKDYDPTRRLHD